MSFRKLIPPLPSPPAEQFQSAGADPPLLKCSRGRGWGGGGGLWGCGLLKWFTWCRLKIF